MLARFVDLLPRRLWRPLNVYVGGRLHFCVGGSHIRTVEWNGRVLAQGRAPFPDEWWEAEMAQVMRELDDDDDDDVGV